MIRKRKPYKFTEKKRSEYIKKLSEGMRRGTAAKALGVHRQTVAAWARDHPDFQDEIDYAELIANEEVEEALFESASGGNITASIFWLCNRMPGKWETVNKIRQEISGPDGGPIETRTSELSDRELDERLGEIVEAVSVKSTFVRKFIHATKANKNGSG